MHPAVPILLLTRPAEGGARVLRACAAELGYRPEAILSPILRIDAVGGWPDLSVYRRVVLTSAHACRGRLDGTDAFCVGARTAEAAREMGARVVHVSADVAHLKAEVPRIIGPALYLRGEEVRADLAVYYGCEERVVYAQRPQPLTAAARAVLAGERPVILPLFSPRSARLVAEGADVVADRVRVLALSPAVARSWKQTILGRAWGRGWGGEVEICAAPSQVDMVGRIVASLSGAQSDKDKR